MKNSVKHIELLDYIRAIAILTVMLDHSLITIYGYENLPWAGWIRDFSSSSLLVSFLPLNLGQTGVAIFFVVSGFCIHMSFQQQGQKWGGFFIRRIFRIYPPYLMALIFFTLFVMEQRHVSFQHQQLVTRYTLEIPTPALTFWTQLWTHLFLVHNFHPATFSGITGAFWSLAVEVQLYLLYPALLLLVAKLGWHRAMVILAGCELLIRGADGMTQTMDAANTIGGLVSGLLARSPFGYWFSWALGAYLADAFLKKQPLPFRGLSLSGWLFLAVFCYLLRPLYPFCFPLFALMTTVVASKYLSGIQFEFKPAFTLKILRKIGLWSYSIYLLHQPLLNIYTNAIGWMLPAYHTITIAYSVTLAGWLIIIPFSILWYELFELTGIALGKGIIQKIDARNAAMVEPQRLQEKSKMKSIFVWAMISALLILVVGSLWANVKFKPLNEAEGNNLAWSLATSPNAIDRNGTLAVKLAEEVCQQTRYQRTVMVGTLAAAYAEAGRFDDAIATAQKAIALAQQNGELNLLKRNQELLELYSQHMAYHEVSTSAETQPAH